MPGWWLLAGALAACASALAVPLAARADADAAGTVAYVALGDSYTSAPFTGASTSVFCAQSNNNYPHLVAAAIQPGAFSDVSCAGAVTDDMTGTQTNNSGLGANPPQFGALTPDTTLVTIGIGGNDVELIDDILECFSLDLLRPTGSACQDNYTAGGVNQISEMIDATAPKLAAVYRGIHARSPQARVLAVGYPAVLPVDGTGCWPLTPLSPGDVSFLASMVVALNGMIATVAAANNVEYVDTYAPTIGYDVCQPFGRAGFTAILATSGISAPLHPNALGEQVMAGAVIHAIDNPPAVTPPAPRKPANPRLKVTRVTIGDNAMTVSGTISSAYRGRVTVTFATRYRHPRVHVIRVTRVARGQWRAKLPIPRRYRGRRLTGTLTATSHRQNGLTAGRARDALRAGGAKRFARGPANHAMNTK
jgi:lysophospholipase L1-like esterase